MSLWFQNAIFYHIYPLGCLGATEKNDYRLPPVSLLRNLNTWILHLRDLGITALYIGPLFESATHGYDTRDFFKVDRRLGTNADLRDFVRSCHDAGIRVVLDAVFNHVGRDHHAFEDLRKNGWDSRHRSWFYTDFRRQSCYGDNFWYEGWNGHYNLVKLNISDSEVKSYIAEVVTFWMREFDIDGLRFDAADVMDKGFFNEMNSICKSRKNDFWLMGEVIHGNYIDWVSHQKLDSVTNYECYKGLWSSHNDRNYFEIAYAVNRQFGNCGIYKGVSLYNFVDNHDVDRVASVLKDPKHLYPLYILLFTIPGVPSIYYGSEWGVKGKKAGGNDLPLRPYIDINSISESDAKSSLFKEIKKLIGIRKRLDVLRRGNYETLFTASEQYCFLREDAGSHVIVCVNSEDNECNVKIPVSLKNTTELVDILNGEEKFRIENGYLKMNIHSCWGRILVAESDIPR